jgi:hypothetical protein
MPPTSSSCSNCKYWVQENGWGQCHRYAPWPCLQLQGENRETHVEAEAIFPRTPAYEWCGDWVKAS